MKLLVGIILSIFAASISYAKLNSRQAMNCIDADAPTKSVFQDLQAAYEMRMVTAKDFFQVMDKAPNCPKLKGDLKKLHSAMMAQLPPPPKGGLGRSRGYATGGSSAATGTSRHEPPSANKGYNGYNDSWDAGFPPPPPAFDDADFDDDFDEFDDF